MFGRAGCALEAREAARQDTACKIVSELVLNESRHTPSLVVSGNSGLVQKAIEMFVQHSKQHALLGASPLIAARRAGLANSEGEAARHHLHMSTR
jgi:hypothetical protein